MKQNLSGTRSLTEYASSMRLCSLYEIKRVNSVPLYLTNHQRAVKFTDNRTYTPSGGLASGAYTGATGFEDATTEITGAITSDQITLDDLRRGTYRGATIIERIVDWRYPWAGAHSTYRYFVEDIKFNGRDWKAELHGLSSLLHKTRGGYYSRLCPATLGDDACKRTLTDVSFSLVSVATVTDKRVFSANLLQIPSGFDGTYFVWGTIFWQAGLNRFLRSTIYDYDDATRTIKIIQPPPFEIAVNDVFQIIAGCDGLSLTCQGKFDHLDHHQGMPFIRGTHQAFNTPQA